MGNLMQKPSLQKNSSDIKTYYWKDKRVSYFFQEY